MGYVIRGIIEDAFEKNDPDIMDLIQQKFQDHIEKNNKFFVTCIANSLSSNSEKIVNNVKFLEKLLTFVTNINDPLKGNDTILHIATEFCNHPDIIQLLLDKGASANSLNE